MTDLKFSKTQLSKIIQSGEFLGALLGKFASTSKKVVALFSEIFLALLATMVLLHTFKKMLGRWFVRTGKGITLLIQMKI